MVTPDLPTVALHDVAIDFGEGPLLEHASLAARPGDVIGVQGANGSGKTSLLRIAARVVLPSSGTREGPESCAYVPPTIDPLPMRSGDWLRLFPRSRRTDPRPLLQAMGFDSDLAKKLGDLSFGNVRKLLLAEALTSGESLVIIDEFSAGLDRKGSLAATEAVASLAAAGTAILLADQQGRTFPSGTNEHSIMNGTLVPTPLRSEESASVRVTLQGQRSRLDELRTAAASVGFEETT